MAAALFAASPGSARAQHFPLGEAGSAGGVEVLRADLTRIVDRAQSGRVGVLVVSLDRGDTLASINPDLPLAPASNLKLFTTATALHLLGPDFRFATYLLADGPVVDGVLQGNLVVYGTGDPAISGRLQPSAAAVWRGLADSLSASGIREVAGGIVADASHWDEVGIARGWTGGDLGAAYAPRASALTTGEGLGGGRPVADPARAAATALRDGLSARGIRVRGPVRRARPGDPSAVGFFGGSTHGLAPTGARVVAEHRSPPLRDLVRVVNQISHNGFADALLKAAGRVAGTRGSFDAGAGAVKRFAATYAAVDTVGLRLEDGSGLSRLNRATPRSLVALLAGMAALPGWPDWWGSLPEAGRPRAAGGLPRMYGTAAAGNLRAKTGTVRGVSALSGYVRGANGERLAFSIISNGVSSTAAAKGMEDRIGARLAEFRR